MEQEYQTSETPLAAYLIQMGFPLADITYELRPSGKRQAIFLFDDSLDLQSHISLFNTGQATINLVLYEHTKASLIDRIMRGQNA